MCDALDFLHSQEIIHRDIKPQNLKLTPSGQIVLLDFGLAKGNPTDAQHQTAAKSIFGYSRSYASLEQIQGTGTEPRRDLYSLSATLYHLLTGIPPADALTRAMNVLNGQPDPLIAANLVNNQVPPGVAEILRKTMALNGGERPVSAIAMRSMLENCDKSINLNAVSSITNTSFTSDLLTQETKIKAATTNIPNSDQSSVKTVISSEITPISTYETRVNDANAESSLTNVTGKAETRKSPNRARAIGAAVFGGLLLVGSAISAVYFYSPEDTPTKTNFGAISPETKSSEVVNPQVNQVNNESPNANLINNNADWTIKNAETNQPDKHSSSKSIVSAKNNVRQAKNQTGKTQAAGKAKVADVESDDAVIINDETIETKDMIIDENGIRMKTPPRRLRPTPVQPPLPSVIFKGLSPAQIERLKQIEKEKRRITIKKFPTPNPAP